MQLDVGFSNFIKEIIDSLLGQKYQSSDREITATLNFQHYYFSTHIIVFSKTGKESFGVIR